MDGSIARPRPLLALGVRLMAAFALATMGMLVKLAGTRGAHLIELIFWRQLLTLVLLGAGLALTGRLAMLVRQLGQHMIGAKDKGRSIDQVKVAALAEAHLVHPLSRGVGGWYGMIRPP